MSRVVAILRRELAAGFALTGLEVLRVGEPLAANAKEALRGAMESATCGLVIVDEGLLELLDERLRAEVRDCIVPLFIPIPGDLVWSDIEAGGEDEHVAELVRRAIGYQLKVQL